MSDNTATYESICVVGSNGMLGQELVAACHDHPKWRSASCHALDCDEMNITSATQVRTVLSALRPDLVINAAAYTDVDGCESHWDEAMAVNRDGPRHLASVCAWLGARLIHVSTDFVFDGQQNRPYRPQDPVNPLGVYGLSKAEGEKLVLNSGAASLIVRTSWLFGVRGHNFVKTIMRLAREGKSLRVVQDQVGRPTYARDLADALLVAAEKQLRGVYHFCNAGVCSWYEFAEEIIRKMGNPVAVHAIDSRELKRQARRPAYSVLDTTDFERRTAYRPRLWQTALTECMAAIESDFLRKEPRTSAQPGREE